MGLWIGDSAYEGVVGVDVSDREPDILTWMVSGCGSSSDISLDLVPPDCSM